MHLFVGVWLHDLDWSILSTKGQTTLFLLANGFYLGLTSKIQWKSFFGAYLIDLGCIFSASEKPKLIPLIRESWRREYILSNEWPSVQKFRGIGSVNHFRQKVPLNDRYLSKSFGPRVKLSRNLYLRRSRQFHSWPMKF
jgi:hypothetical protein